MIKQNVKYPTFSEYDFIRLYCALNVRSEQSPILVHHELEKKLYNFYSIPEFKTLFQDICPKRDYVNPENSYLALTTALQTAQTFGLLIQIQGVGEIRSIISCDEQQADEIVANYDDEIIGKMTSLFNELLNSSNNLREEQTIPLFTEEEIRIYQQESPTLFPYEQIFRNNESTDEVTEQHTQKSGPVLKKTKKTSEN